MIFLKKCMEIWYFLQMPQKHGLSKKTSRWNVTFLYIWKDCIFFLGKHDFFFDGKWKMIFLKKYMEIWYFLYICINVTNMILPFFKKSKRWSSPEKNTLEADWHSRSHSRKSSISSLYFYEDLHRHFHILLSSETKSGNLIYWTEFNFFFNLFGWRYSTMKNLQFSAPVSLQEWYYLEVCLRTS